jgi:hypothetical protein
MSATASAGSASGIDGSGGRVRLAHKHDVKKNKTHARHDSVMDQLRDSVLDAPILQTTPEDSWYSKVCEILCITSRLIVEGYLCATDGFVVYHLAHIYIPA